MKTLGKLLLITSTFIIITWVIGIILAIYKYDNKCESYWQLATKASSIPQKSTYVDKYVASLESCNLHGKYNAIFLETPDNSFDENFKALQSLQTRLHEIQAIDVSSFEYQTAIQQITAQEQDGADQMIDVFATIWLKDYNILLWDWIGILFIIFTVICGTTGIAMMNADD